MPVDLAVALDRAAPTPMAVQLAGALRAAAQDGRLRVGDRVPSTRALAVQLGVSRTVTAAAYDQLLAEGWLAARHGAGTFVAAAPGPVRGDLHRHHRADAPASGEPPRSGRTPAGAPPGPGRPAPGLVASGVPGPGATASGAAGLVASGVPVSGVPVSGVAASGAPVDDLRPGAPCLAVLDRAAWRRAWRRAGDADPAARPEYAGLPGYRAVVADQLLRHRGLPADPATVLATAGTTAGFGELLGVLGDRLGRPPRVAVEDPGYARAVGVVRASGAEVVGVRVDTHGLDADAVPTGVDVVYTTPAHQYPLGARLAVDRRSRLVERARDEGFVVVEDDYDGELRYDVAPLPLLAALGPDVVVHLGTTSKVLSPTLGAGWAVAPPALHGALLDRRRRAGQRPAPAGQAVAAALGHDGALGRHLTRLRRELAARRTAVVAAVHGAGHTVRGDRAGAHLVVPLADAAAESAVAADAGARGLAVAVLGELHLDPAAPDRAHGLLVGWAGPERGRLPDVLDRLGAVLATVAPG